MTAAKSSRVTKIQTPGAPNPPADNPSSEGEKQEVGADAAGHGVAGLDAPNATPAATATTKAEMDVDAMREQIRAEERAKLQEELQASITGAETVLKAPARATLDRPNRQQYAQMREHEVDPTTITSAVLTKDGWVCPAPAPAAKK